MMGLALRRDIRVCFFWAVSTIQRRWLSMSQEECSCQNWTMLDEDINFKPPILWYFVMAAEAD